MLFLKAKGIYLAYDEAEFEADRLTHEQLRREGKLGYFRSVAPI